MEVGTEMEERGIVEVDVEVGMEMAEDGMVEVDVEVGTEMEEDGKVEVDVEERMEERLPRPRLGGTMWRAASWTLLESSDRTLTYNIHDRTLFILKCHGQKSAF